MRNAVIFIGWKGKGVRVRRKQGERGMVHVKRGETPIHLLISCIPFRVLHAPAKLHRATAFHHPSHASMEKKTH